MKEKTPFSDRDRITPESLRRERAAVRFGVLLFWVFVFGGLALTLWIITPAAHH